MQNHNSINSMGTCFGCQQIIAAHDVLAHFAVCQLERHDAHAVASEQIFMLRVETAGQFWLFAEVSGHVTLEKLYQFLRSSWFECCGHISPLQLNGQTLSTTDLQKTVATALSVGAQLSYAHTGGEVPAIVVGDVISQRVTAHAHDLRLASRKNIQEERCPTCIETTH